MTAARTPEVGTHLTREQAAERYGQKVGMVWDEESQQFVAMGTALVFEQMGKPVDLAKNLQVFEVNRQVVLKFIQGAYFEEAKYDEKGNLILGQLGDYYKVPGSDQKALTKRGASKIKQLFRWARGAARRVAGEETKEYCSATIEMPIVDTYGRVVGAGIGSCSTAEKAFTSQNAIKKYGGWCDWNKEKKQLEVSRAPDYRAALHDIISKATKRADTQATIVAAALEELFTVPAEDEDDRTKGAADAQEPAPVYPAQPGQGAPFRLPKATSGLLAQWGGKLLSEVPPDVLAKLAKWARAVGVAKKPAVWIPIADAIETHMAARADQVLEEAQDDLPF